MKKKGVTKAERQRREGAGSVFSYLLLGLLAGFVSGFFGAGGGVVLLLGGMLLSRRRGGDRKGLFASTVFVIAVLSVVSAVIYFLRGHLPPMQTLRYLLPAAAGGMLGALLLHRLPTTLVRRIFAVLVIVAGGMMLFGR